MRKLLLALSCIATADAAGTPVFPGDTSVHCTMLADGLDLCTYDNLCVDPPQPTAPYGKVHFISSSGGNERQYGGRYAAELQPHVFDVKSKWQSSRNSLRELAKTLYLRVARVRMPPIHRGSNFYEEFDLTHKDISHLDAPFAPRLLPLLMDESRPTVGFIKPERAVPKRFGGDFAGSVAWVPSLYVAPSFWLHNGHLWGSPTSLVHPLLSAHIANSSLRLDLPPLDNLVVLGTRLNPTQHGSPFAGSRKRYVSALFHAVASYIGGGSDVVQGFKLSAKSGATGSYDSLPPIASEDGVSPVRSYTDLVLGKPFPGARMIYTASDIPPQPPVTVSLKEPSRICAHRAVVLGHKPGFIGGAAEDVIWTRLMAEALGLRHLARSAKHHHRMGNSGGGNNGGAPSASPLAAAAASAANSHKKADGGGGGQRTGRPHDQLRALVLDRRGTDKSRRLLNAAEALAVLRKYNVSATYVTDDQIVSMSFAQQAALWASHRLVVAVHGAALYSSVFMPRGSVLIELLPFGVFKPGYAKAAAYAGIAHLPLYSHVKGPDLRYGQHFGPDKNPGDIAAICDQIGYAALTRSPCFHLFRDGAVAVPMARFESHVITAVNILSKRRVLPRNSAADALDGVQQAHDPEDLDADFDAGVSQARQDAFCGRGCSFE